MAVLCKVLLMVLLFSNISHAADTAAVAAALPDEASECRYLLMLCEEARTAAASNLKGVRNPENGIAVLRDSKGNLIVTTAQEVLDKIQLAREAAKVIRAKHDKAPWCFQQCNNGVLDLEKYK